MTATAGTSEQIAHVYDQYLNFIVAEPDLFSLGMEKDHVYWALNSAKTQDEELDHVVDKIVSGLFSVVVTMGVIPIIRASRGAAAEMIAQKLVTDLLSWCQDPGAHPKINTLMNLHWWSYFGVLEYVC